MVLMTVAGSSPRVILLSEVREEYEAQCESRRRFDEALGERPPLTPQEKRHIYLDVKRKHRNHAVRAQAAWSLTDSPEQIKKFVTQRMREKKDEQIKMFGSVNKLNQERGLMSRSQYMKDRRDRQQILYNLAQQDLVLRFRDKLALMVSPKELWALYQKRRPQMKSPPRSDLAMLVFPIGDPKSEAATMARAKEVAAAWRSTDKSSEEMAEPPRSRALPDRLSLTAARAREFLPAFIAEFIDAAKSPKVSEPILHQRAVYVLKITAWHPAEEFQFEDRRVQQLLRQELVNEKQLEILRRAERRDRDKVFIWEARVGPQLGPRRR